jgi:hypothetical protein
MCKELWELRRSIKELKTRQSGESKDNGFEPKLKKDKDDGTTQGHPITWFLLP